MPGPRGSLYATSPLAVITATVTVTNSLDAPHIVGVAAAPAAGAPSWTVLTGPGRLLAPGASASVPITVEVPISAGDGMRMPVRLRLQTAVETDRPVTVDEQTLFAWTGGDMVEGTYVGCRGDLDADGIVLAQEADSVAERFDARRDEAAYEAALDFDHDDRIGAADVQAVAGRVGQRCGPLVDIDSSVLRAGVGMAPVRAHLEALQAVADANNGNRSAGTTGYRASVDYVAGVLAAEGYRNVRNSFEYPIAFEPPPADIEVLSPEAATWVPGADFLQATFSPAVDITADVVPVDVTVPPAPETSSTSGCEEADYAGFPRGAIALVQRGTCSFGQKASMAAWKGASAVVMFNEGQVDRTEPFPIDLGGIVFPVSVFAARYALGEAIVLHVRAGGTVRMHIRADQSATLRREENVIAEWPSSEDDDVVMIGAHLDSVRNGPGINDDGSGVAAVLEIARQVARLDLRPKHRLRFAFWGAEEIASWGSSQYLDGLTAAERHQIIAYLNFDMIASVNPMRDVYWAQYKRDGADDLSALLERWFDRANLPHEQTWFSGGLDSDSFEWRGIPTSGVFTGHDLKLSPAQAAKYHGTPDAPMDPCYHRSCDTIANINWTILEEMIAAAAHATWSVANDDFIALTSRRARPLPTRPPNAVADAAPSPVTLEPPARVAALDSDDHVPSASIAQLPDEITGLAVDVEGMAAFELTLSFDPASVEILGAQLGDFVPDGSRTLGPVLAPGRLAIGSAAGAARFTTGAGRVVHIRYRMLRGGAPPRVRIERDATGVFDHSGTVLGPPAAVRVVGAAVESAWLPWGGVER
ncbi:MAG: M20/M25/M40 family metallo-hydrolase [Ardenticatenales bacterium]